MKYFLLSFLFLTGCATTCDYEATHVFMKKNKFIEICYTIHSPENAAGNYCLKKMN